MSTGSFKSHQSRKSKRATSPSIRSWTNNPDSEDSRIFVGNIVRERFTSEEVKDRFKAYGNVYGVSIHKGFAFVQFENPTSAIKAIQEEDKTMFKDALINVMPAASNSSRPNRGRGSSPPRSRGYRGPDRGSRDRSPIEQNRDFYGDRYSDPGTRDLRGSTSRYPNDARSLYAPHPYRDPPVASSQPNDCEIIVVVKELRQYGEYVESRLKNLGLTVDMLFLKDTAALLPTIDSIARRGSLFAVVVSDQNESHRSVTLNILHSTPQEHRNMPLDDAMKLVAVNYHEYVQSGRDKKTKSEQPRPEIKPPTQVVSAGGYVAPVRNAKLQNLLQLLVEGKHLTSTELEVVISHLQDQRNKIIARERGDHLLDKRTAIKTETPLGFAGNSNSSFGSDQMMREQSPSIPSWGNIPPKQVNALPTPMQPQQDPNPFQVASRGGLLNFDNPTVQKALDNLIQNGPNLLQSVLGANQPQAGASNSHGQDNRSDGGLNQGGNANALQFNPHLTSADHGVRHALLGNPVSNRYQSNNAPRFRSSDGQNHGSNNFH